MLENYATVVLSLLPFIALIGLGGWLKHIMRERDGVTPDWKTLDWVCYWVLNPALLFTSAAMKPLTPGAVVATGGWIWLLMLGGFAFASVLWPLTQLRPVEVAARAQTAWRFNSVVGLAATSLISPEALQVMAIFIGASVPLANALAVTALAVTSGQREPGWLRKCLWSVALNPFFLASAGGLLFSLSLRDVPAVMDNALVELVMRFLTLLAEAAIPLSLIAVGAAVIWANLLRTDRVGLYLHAVKFALLPALVWLAAVSLPIPPVTAAAFLVFAALPTSTSSHILGAAYGAEREPTALIVSQSTILACLLLPVWMAVALSLL